MDMQRHASEAPLLKTPLTQRAADTTAAETGVPLRSTCQVMLGTHTRTHTPFLSYALN